MPKRKINQRDYTHYLIGYRNNAPVIISGWSNAEDARDAKKEWPELRSSVWSKVGAKRTGLDPDDNSNWTTSRGDGGVKDSETDGFGAAPSKYVVEYIVQGNYGHGWDDLTAHDTRRAAVLEARVYADNEPNAHRVITRRSLRYST